MLKAPTSLTLRPLEPVRKSHQEQSIITMEDNIWGDIATPSFTSSAVQTTVTTATAASVKERAQTDDKLRKIEDSLSNLEDLKDLDAAKHAWVELVQLVTNEDRDEEFTTFTDLLSTAMNVVNDRSITGVALIHYIIIYNKPGYIDLLVSKVAKLDLNILDDLVGYSPLMWCFWLTRKECCTELFTVSDRLNFQLKNKEDHTAWDILSTGSAMYAFLDQNNMLKYGMIDVLGSSAIGGTANARSPADSIFGATPSSFDNEVNANIDKKLAGMSLYEDEEFKQKLNKEMFGKETNNEDSYSYTDFEKFDFNKLQKYQYLEYSDYDIPQILDYLINLPKFHPHMTTYPAALLYQCARYSDYKKKSKADTESLLFLAFTKISASISTVNNNDTSTETSEADDKHKEHDKKKDDDCDKKADEKPRQTVDIVTQSYWISALTYLYYYLTKDESFFKRHPNILQELINALHNIIIELVTSIHERLVPVIQKTLINYTTIEDVKQTLYKRDWNFFKKRKQAKLAKKEQEKKLQKQQELKLQKSKSRSSATNEEASSLQEEESTDTIDSENNEAMFDDEILKHLYPPSLEEQMKPSPMKIVQIFGALSYVLNLHQIHPLFQQQCLSIAINWFSTTLFNQILKDKKKKVLSRARAVQIRLNLSTLESWVRNNDITVSRPKLIDDFMWERFPYTLVQDLGDIDLNNPTLHSITTFRPVEIDAEKTITDQTNSLFYYQTFHQIAFFHLGPVSELLQWLQIVTSLDSEEALENTIKLLPQLTLAQLLKAADKYNYEVNEHKFNSKLRKSLSKMSKATLIKKTYLEEKQIPLLCLPTVTELTDTFAHDEDSQPFLPDDIQDAVYEIHDANHRIRMNDIHYKEPEVESEDDDVMCPNVPPETNTFDIINHQEHSHSNEHNTNEKEEGDDNFGQGVSPPSELGNNGDTIFSSFNAPSSSVAGPSWASTNHNDDVDANPW